MNDLKRFAFVFIASGALASAPGFAQQRDLPRQPPGEPMQGMMQDPGMMGMMHGMMMGGMGDGAGRERPQLTLALQNRAELGLTEPQVTKLEGLVQRFRGTAEQRMRDIEAAEAELAALLKQDGSAGPQVEAKVRAIEKLRADLRLERIRTIAEGRAALGPEQRAKLDQVAAASGGGMMGMGRGGMPGMEGMDHGSQGGSSRPEQKK
jgi:Spy/CpxP family protein refolding chaperone